MNLLFQDLKLELDRRRRTKKSAQILEDKDVTVVTKHIRRPANVSTFVVNLEAMSFSGIRFVASVRLSVRLHYRVRSINPIPIEGFSSHLAEMFTSTRGCLEPMLPMCQCKVKVTIEGQI